MLGGQIRKATLELAGDTQRSPFSFFLIKGDTRLNERIHTHAYQFSHGSSFFGSQFAQGGNLLFG